MRSLSIALLAGLVLSCGLASGSEHSEKTAERRKARFVLMKKEHEKRWAFEDELLSAERAFADGIRRERREAEQKRDAALATATDSKGEAEAHRVFNEQDRGLQQKVADERKSVAERRHKHQKEMDDLRKEFLKELNKK